MLTGAVNAQREAVVRLRLRGPAGIEEDSDAVIDTGFTDYIAVPPAVIASLAMPLGGSLRAELADGNEVDIDVYPVEVIWNGQPRTVTAMALDGGTLIGMALLYGTGLHIEVIDGGLVTISPLP